jgi:hypothetical protein
MVSSRLQVAEAVDESPGPQARPAVTRPGDKQPITNPGHPRRINAANEQRHSPSRGAYARPCSDALNPFLPSSAVQLQLQGQVQVQVQAQLQAQRVPPGANEPSTKLCRILHLAHLLICPISPTRRGESRKDELEPLSGN